VCEGERECVCVSVLLTVSMFMSMSMCVSVSVYVFVSVSMSMSLFVSVTNCIPAIPYTLIYVSYNTVLQEAYAISETKVEGKTAEEIST